MFEIKDVVLIGSTVAAIASAWAALRVGFSKDIKALKEADSSASGKIERLKNDMDSKVEDMGNVLSASIQELKDKAPMDAAESNSQFTKMHGLIQNLSLEVQTLKIKEAQSEERRRHHTDMLEQTKGLVSESAKETRQFQNDMIQQLSRLATKLDERTKNQHS